MIATTGGMATGEYTETGMDHYEFYDWCHGSYYSDPKPIPSLTKQMINAIASIKAIRWLSRFFREQVLSVDIKPLRTVNRMLFSRSGFITHKAKRKLKDR